MGWTLDLFRKCFGKEFFFSKTWEFSWTGYERQMKITVQRKRVTEDSIIGKLFLEWDGFSCFTIENKDKAIPPGEYTVDLTYSNRFNRQMPIINVPERSGIRIHWANFGRQLEGCIAVGNQEQNNAVDNSRETFNQLFKLLSGRTGMKIEVKEV